MKHVHRRMLMAIVCGAVAIAMRPLPAIAGDENSYVPPHGKATVLFDGKGLDNFDSFLETKGLNNDPEHVFIVEKGVIHVSGAEFGYLITKREFENYYLRAEFKWGEATHPPREGMARDSGILYHIQGPQKVWPTSIEYQICEGQTGDFYMTDGAALTGTDGKRVTGPPNSAARIVRIGEGPWQNVTGYRDPNGEIEKPRRVERGRDSRPRRQCEALPEWQAGERRLESISGEWEDPDSVGRGGSLLSGCQGVSAEVARYYRSVG